MSNRRRSAALWSIQTLLAALFIFAGASKLVLPLESMQGPIALPGLFIRFIGVAELLGGIGLVLPGLLRTHRELTIAAAVGLVLIMSGATALTVLGGAVAPAAIPGIVGILAATVVFGRREWAS